MNVLYFSDNSKRLKSVKQFFIHNATKLLRYRFQAGKWILLVLFLALITACSTSKRISKVSYPNLNEDAFFSALEQQGDAQLSSFEVSKFSADYKNTDQTKSFKGFIRLKTDSAFMLSVAPLFGIELFRLLLTNDSVAYIDRYNKMYFRDVYQSIKKVYDLDLNYPIVESLFLGSLPNFLDHKLVKQHFSKNADFYTIHYDIQENGSILSLSYAFDKNLVLKKVLLSNNSNATHLTADYKSYFDEPKMKYIPKNIVFTRYTSSSMDVVELEYKNVTRNKALNFPFSISGKYTRISQ